MGLKEIETPNAMISYFAEQLGPLIEKSRNKTTHLFILGIDEKGGKRKSNKEKSSGKISPKLFRWCILPNSY